MTLPDDWKRRWPQLQTEDQARRMAWIENGSGPEADELIARCAAKGVQLALREGSVRVTKGAAKLTAAEREELEMRRYDLAAWLAGDLTRGVRRLDGAGCHAFVLLREEATRRRAAYAESD